MTYFSLLLFKQQFLNLLVDDFKCCSVTLGFFCYEIIFFLNFLFEPCNKFLLIFQHILLLRLNVFPAIIQIHFEICNVLRENHILFDDFLFLQFFLLKSIGEYVLRVAIDFLNLLQQRMQMLPF